MQAHEGLVSSVAQLKASLQAKEEELASQASLFAEEREAAKDQMRKLSLELADARGQLELQVSACVRDCCLSWCELNTAGWQVLFFANICFLGDA